MPQRTKVPVYGSAQKRATRARTSRVCTSAMRGCGGISKPRSSSKPEPAPFGVGAEELVDAQLGPVRVARDVDQQMAEHAVDEPRRRGLVGMGGGKPVEFGERDLELVEPFVAALVDAGPGSSGR